MNPRKCNYMGAIVMFAIAVNMDYAFCSEKFTLRIENTNISQLFAIPVIFNLETDTKVQTEKIDNEENNKDETDDVQTWVVDRRKIDEKFRVVIANGHQGIKQNYVYFEDFNLSKSGKELKINLKSYVVNIDVLIDPSFAVPKKGPNSGTEVIAQLFKIDDVGAVSITESAEKIGDNLYRHKILVFQPGRYWVQVRYQGGKIYGNDNKYLGYPVWGKIIDIGNEPTNLKIVGGKEKAVE